jgi:uncharacterized protein (TIGR01244 family)
MRRLWIIPTAIALIVGMFALNLVVSDNFHTVSPGQIYRSAQMTPDALSRAVQQHGIKTVVNLRGNVEEDWYNAETNASAKLGVKHYDFSLSATTELTDPQMGEILATIAAAPKPVLIHCKSGSDRTGLISALCVYDLDGKSASAASRQLSVLYGHVPWFGNATVAMDRSFWRYVSNHIQHSMPGGSLAKTPAESNLQR